LPVPTSTLDRTLSLAAIDSAPGPWIGCIGAWAADRGRWEDHAHVIQELRDLSSGSVADADTVAARRLEAVARALEGYAAWKRGRPDEAFRILDAARPHLDSYHTPTALPIAWWIGHILRELGRPAEAVRYFRTQALDPLSHYELGKIYDAVGEDGKAREEYEVFLAAWRDADPELRPVVERARSAMARLADERRSRRF
jgi:tetratricopeptide (TPR) repeat protein